MKADDAIDLIREYQKNNIDSALLPTVARPNEILMWLAQSSAPLDVKQKVLNAHNQGYTRNQDLISEDYVNGVANSKNWPGMRSSNANIIPQQQPPMGTMAPSNGISNTFNNNFNFGSISNHNSNSNHSAAPLGHSAMGLGGMAQGRPPLLTEFLANSNSHHSQANNSNMMSNSNSGFGMNNFNSHHSQVNNSSMMSNSNSGFGMNIFNNSNSNSTNNQNFNTNFGTGNSVTPAIGLNTPLANPSNGQVGIPSLPLSGSSSLPLDTSHLPKLPPDSSLGPNVNSGMNHSNSNNNYQPPTQDISAMSSLGNSQNTQSHSSSNNNSSGLNSMGAGLQNNGDQLPQSSGLVLDDNASMMLTNKFAGKSASEAMEVYTSFLEDGVTEYGNVMYKGEPVSRPIHESHAQSVYIIRAWHHLKEACANNKNLIPKGPLFVFRRGNHVGIFITNPWGSDIVYSPLQPDNKHDAYKKKGKGTFKWTKQAGYMNDAKGTTDEKMGNVLETIEKRGIPQNEKIMDTVGAMMCDARYSIRGYTHCIGLLKKLGPIQDFSEVYDSLYTNKPIYTMSAKGHRKDEYSGRRGAEQQALHYEKDDGLAASVIADFSSNMNSGMMDNSNSNDQNQGNPIPDIQIDFEALAVAMAKQLETFGVADGVVPSYFEDQAVPSLNQGQVHNTQGPRPPRGIPKLNSNASDRPPLSPQILKLLESKRALDKGGYSKMDPESSTANLLRYQNLPSKMQTQLIEKISRKAQGGNKHQMNNHDSNSNHLDPMSLNSNLGNGLMGIPTSHTNSNISPNNGNWSISNGTHSNNPMGSIGNNNRMFGMHGMLPSAMNNDNLFNQNSSQFGSGMNGNIPMVDDDNQTMVTTNAVADGFGTGMTPVDLTHENQEIDMGQNNNGM